MANPSLGQPREQPARNRQVAASPPAATLTPRQERFVTEYLLDDNASRAYAAAGYHPTTPGALVACSSRLLASANVQSALAARRAKLAAHAQITREMLIDQLRAIAFGDPRDVVVWGPAGVQLRPSGELTPEQATTVAEVIETPGRYGVSRRVRRESRLEAIEKIARMLGYYPREPVLVDNRTVNLISSDDVIVALLEARRQLATAEGEE